MKNDKELLKVAILSAIAGTIVAIIWYIIYSSCHLSFAVGCAVPVGLGLVAIIVSKVLDKKHTSA